MTYREPSGYRDRRPDRDERGYNEDRHSPAKSNPLSRFTFRQKAGAVAIAMGAAIIPTLAFGKPLRKAPADKIAISYGGGAFEGAQYQKITNPGSGLVFNGLSDSWYQYPTTQRDYIVSLDSKVGEKAEPDSINVTDGDGVIQQVELKVTFKLNTNLLRGFHEQLGLKKEAWTDKGWNDMLEANFRQPLENAVTKALKQFTTDEITKGPETYSKIEDAISENLKRDVTRLAGEEYFCGPGFKIGDEECPDFELVVNGVDPLSKDISTSYDKIKQSANGIQVATNEATQKEKRAVGEKAAKDVVSDALTPEYLEYLQIQANLDCAKNDKCTMVIDGSGATQTVVPIGR
jgi:hypothetical protein